MHPTVKVVARFPETVNSSDMGVPVHQVKEFAPRLSFGCSISGLPYLSLAMLDHPSQVREVDDGWPRMAIYYAMITGGSGSVGRLPAYRDPVVKYAFADQGHARPGRRDAQALRSPVRRRRRGPLSDRCRRRSPCAVSTISIASPTPCRTAAPA